jgi:hypothetical protein
MSGSRSAILAALAAFLTADGSGNILLDQSPSQFDSSLKLATTAFAQAIGLRGVPLVLAGVTTLAASTAGSTVALTGSAAYAVTLPLLASVPLGSMYEFINISPNAITLSRQGTSDNLTVNGPSITSFVVNPGDSVFVESLNGVWVVSGSGALSVSSSFASGSNGQGTWFKFPSGLIIQMGAIVGSSGWAWSFPIAFPTNCLACMATNVDTGASFTSLYNWTATATYGNRWSLSGGNPTGETALVAFGH